MNSAEWSFISVALGTTVGAAASILTTLIANAHQTRLHSREESRRRAEDFKAFQRQNLLEVQETFQEVARDAFALQFAYLKAHNRGSPWGKVATDDDLSIHFARANRRLFALVERVADDALRSSLDEAHKQQIDISLSSSREQFETRCAAAEAPYRDVMSRLGEVLRSTL